MIRQALTLVAAATLTLAAAGCNRDADKPTAPKSGSGDSMTKPGTPTTPPSTGAPGGTPPSSSSPSGTPESSSSPTTPPPSGTPEKKGNP